MVPLLGTVPLPPPKAFNAEVACCIVAHKQLRLPTNAQLRSQTCKLHTSAQLRPQPRWPTPRKLPKIDIEKLRTAMLFEDHRPARHRIMHVLFFVHLNRQVLDDVFHFVWWEIHNCASLAN